MSRIGSKAIEIPSGVDAKVDGNTVSVKGPKGELSFTAGDEVVVAMEDGLRKAFEAADIGYD